jgi:hypothetical protein
LILFIKELAKIEENRENFSKQTVYLEKAMEIASEFSLKRELYYLELELSKLKMGSNDLVAARKLILSAQSKTFSLKNKAEEGIFYENYGLLSFLEKKLEEALKYSKIAYDIYNSYHKPQPLARVTYLLAKIYKLLDDRESSHSMIDLTINISKHKKYYSLLYEAYIFKSELYAQENDIRSSNIYKSYGYQLKREHLKK